MIGLLRPLHGEVVLCDELLWKGAKDPSPQLLHKLGVLYQSGALWSSMNVLDNVSLPLQMFTKLSKQEIREIAHYKLSLVGLTGYESLFPSELSGGMKKRAGLARAMVTLDVADAAFGEAPRDEQVLPDRRLPIHFAS